jgi:hypothetical protein
VQVSLRKTLGDSHIGAVTIALLLFISLKSLLQALPHPLMRVFGFVITAVAIRDVPYIPHPLDVADKMTLLGTASLLYNAFTCFIAAWLMSRWIYRATPLRILSSYWSKLSRREDE